MAASVGSNLGLYHSWDLGESQWNTGNDLNLLLLDVLVQAEVSSATVLSEPVGPSTGDRFILPVGCTGTYWLGHDLDLSVFDGSDWLFFSPKQGWRIRSTDNMQTYIYDNGAWTLEGSLYSQYVDDAAASAGGLLVGSTYIKSSTGAVTIRIS